MHWIHLQLIDVFDVTQINTIQWTAKPNSTPRGWMEKDLAFPNNMPNRAFKISGAK